MKKGLFDFLTGGKKDKTGSCCGGFELEEIPDGSEGQKDTKNSRSEGKVKNGSCCDSFELEEMPDRDK